ncbi:uncharacterized protein LOC115888674 [Sitophilus oryzae]|uniref:Uncharacterized protein LOC115888674 n=1 Tax=Sitophilus oryzae TaxID=7048 RepID=A0A6J2YNA7_SITOR|nr:uncharacterized protein LOC115888674 [Sitophilus oryzae]
MDDTDGGPGKILRAKSLKRGKPEERITDRVKLERVLGVTVASNASLGTDNNGIIAYPAGCTVVLFNIRTEQQNHIINTSRKTITSLAYSSCGRYIVTGECGHQPAVRVWDLQSDPQSGHPGLAPQPQQVAEFLGHKYGVNCVAFSPTNKYVVSVGTQHDMIVNVWDWKNNIKVASNKVSTKVKAIAFSENGNYFVTVGNRHVKFWFLESGKNKYKEAVPLMGRSAILGEQRNNYFCDVACGKGECGDSTYAITRSGLLCEFNNRRLLDKWVELRTTSANCITVGQKHIFVGCAEGIIRCFDPTTLRFITTLPRCHYLGVDVSLGTNIQHMASPPQDAKYPDTVAITFDETNNKLTAVYNDHSIYIWDVFNIKRVGKSCSFLYHSACIWGVEMAPQNSGLPPGSFLTCSSDDTIRVWTLDKMNEKNSRGMYQQNVYSNDLLKVVYIDKDLSYIKDLDISGTVTNDKQPDQTSYDGKNGVRSIRISPNGKHLASGDRSGNIRIHDIAQMKELYKIEAHDSEVLCLEYSANESSYSLLASASRDRLIHVFDTKNGYDFVQTLDDHSSSITAVRFLNHSNNIQMISCGADKSLIFRSLGEFNGKVQFARDHNATGKTTLYDMEVDTGQKHVLTACQDRNVRIYNVTTGKHTKTFKGSTGDDGTLIKVVLDRSGIYLATSCTDKSLSVYDYYSGECMATMCGHSELATGLRFTNDCRRLVSASGDGCIFVWRIPHDMVITMQARLSQQAMRQGKMLESEMFNENSNFDIYEGISNIDANYRFSIGQLPQWAKKQLTEESSQPPSVTKGVAAPKGRWAQRAEFSTTLVQSLYGGNPVLFPAVDRRLDSDGSKESSLDSGTDLKLYQETKKVESMSMTSKISPNITIRDRNRRGIMTDDSAIGDISLRRPLYYPSLADSPSGNEYTVTNIDADELRKSQRKKKTPQILIQQPTTGTYDSEDDDDDASTPSGENTDRNPMSLFSVSSESLDQLVNRERYLQSTFESMSGAETEHHTPSNKSSFSSKFLTNSGNKNIEAINAVKMTKSDPEAIKKRQELNKRIAETKKKLESFGHVSPLKYSQSIHDLSHIPERDKWSKKQADIDSANASSTNTTINKTDPCSVCTSISTSFTDFVPSSKSVPVDLQLCGCFMSDIEKNTTQLSQILNLSRDNDKTCSKSRPLSLSGLNTVNFDAESISFRESLEKATKSPERSLESLIRPRKLKLDKTLTKYKMHKSLPVSPVSEERQFADFVDQQKCSDLQQRQSFSYFLDLDPKSTDEGFRQVCSDIEKFSVDFNKKYDQIEKNFPVKSAKGEENNPEDEDGNFSSDSLEDYNFFSYSIKKGKKNVPPRRCVSNNEIYRYQEEYIEEIPKSESFYLNQNYSIQGSQESILSDENNLDYNDFYRGEAKSYCNSLESVISNDSDCKSAPLEILFEDKRKELISEGNCKMPHSQSLPKNISCKYDTELSSSLPKNFIEHHYTASQPIQASSGKKSKGSLKTCQTQTDFETPQQIVAKKAGRGSEDFQKKLLKFESTIAQSTHKKPVAFFVETNTSRGKSNTKLSKENVPINLPKNSQKTKHENSEMYIPTLASKNKQYKSKFCNVLNNKPDQNLDIFEERANGKNNGNNFTLSTINFERNGNRNNIQETSSLDRHLFAKGLLNANEKITHKPPKAVRRHSSKNRKSKTTYEYIRKEDFFKNNTNVKGEQNLCTDPRLLHEASVRRRPLYYPSLADSPSGNEYTVTNIDADELRKSQRKKKTPQILIQQPTTGTYDSEDDDDDASTPSGENTDRNPMSLFSVSSESLDQLVNRERYLQSTFESMSGAETEHHTPSNKSSFSSKFLTNSGNKNIEAINAVKMTKSDPEAIKKRQELNKRIAETKKKLESFGHVSPLKYSQSIHDLSHIPERDKWSKKQADIDSANASSTNTTINKTDPCSVCTSISTSFTDFVPSSKSVPVDLQLCGCFMSDIEKNTTQLSQILNLSRDNDKTCSKSRPLSLSGLNTVNFDAESISFRESLEKATKSPERSLESLVRPRKLKLDKTLTKYKMHKSLPVSPVSEERQFADFVDQQKCSDLQQRQSFSYFLDLDPKSTDEGFRQVCSDIEKFSVDFNKKYDQIEKNFPVKSAKNEENNPEDEDGNFSSDSLEDYNFFSYSIKKGKKNVPPRRCVSNNEIYRYQEEYIEEIPKSESFYLNQNYSIQGSQESILSDENNLDYNDFYRGEAKSYCNSLESVISNDSDCKSALLEILFEDKRKELISEGNCKMPHSQSLPKNISCKYDTELSSSLPKNFIEHHYTASQPIQASSGKKSKGGLKTCQTQTDFETPQQIVAKKAGRGSEDFQKKLLKFESTIAQSTHKKPVAFFVETNTSRGKSNTKLSKENVPINLPKNSQKTKHENSEMYIPTLASKNKQYKSKFCNVLNNKPDQNLDMFEERANGKNNGNNFTLSTINFERNGNRNNIQETSSLDRHLFAKGLLNANEKITHKPPKAVRRHSSKNRKSKTTYEYIRKEDFFKNNTNVKGEQNLSTDEIKGSASVLNNRTKDLVITGENTIELRFKEKNIECDVEAGSCRSRNNVLNVKIAEGVSKFDKKSEHQNNILTELYDSLDKKSPPSKMDLDSLDINLNTTNNSDTESTKNFFGSLELNVWGKSSCVSKNAALHLENVLMKQSTNEKPEKKVSPQDKIATALQNIKILNEIQRKIHQINTLIDIYRKNVSKSKVKALSSMYESFLTTSQSYYNDLTKLQATPLKYRRRNLSLPSFVERRLNSDSKSGNGVPSKLATPTNNQDDRNIEGDAWRKILAAFVFHVFVAEHSCLYYKHVIYCYVYILNVIKINKIDLYLDDTSSPESSLRRSCSLSDLSMQNASNLAKRKPEQTVKKPAPPARMTPRYVKNNSMMRSKSSVMLNQQHSDSENDSQDKKMSRLMRPTISSHNKMSQKSLQARKKQSYSTSNLNQIGIDNVSTSDDEETIKKPQVPPRMSRQQSFENGQSTKRLMNNKDQKRSSRHSIHFDDTLTNEDIDISSESMDFSSIEFSNQLCEDVSKHLVRTADNVVKIYEKLKENEEAGESQAEAMDCIKMSLIRTHKVVHDCIFNEFKQNNGNIDVNQTDAIKKLNDLVSKGASGSGSVIDLMQQYSDILLDMMQQKIHSSNI